MNHHKLPLLPPPADLETKAILRQLVRSNRSLAELKGYADTIPNKHILINAIMLNEAKESSEIENIVTTHDELYKAMSTSNNVDSVAKEVMRYRQALWLGYQSVKQSGSLTVNTMKKIQEIVCGNLAGIRKLPGTVLRNERTGESVYVPPEGEVEILEYLSNLEKYINSDDSEIDTLIKMAVIHYQFESIHPFYDGNGRTGRIINVVYLVLKELLDSPILYLSSYIIRTKETYYRLFEEIRNNENWEPWIIYMLKGIQITADETLKLVKKIHGEEEAMRKEIMEKLPRLYTKELIDLLFTEFYTKITYIEKGLGVTRKTASTYLATLEKEGFLVSEKIGKEKIYLNKRLYDLIQKPH